MKKKILGLLTLVLVAFVGIISLSNKNEAKSEVASLKKIKKKKKTIAEKMRYAKEREMYELGFQINPITGTIPLEEKEQEYNTAQKLLNTNQGDNVHRGVPTIKPDLLNLKVGGSRWYERYFR